MLTLLLGGARSGKSRFAEMIARKRGDIDVVYLATSQVHDEEMEERVKRHRQSRPGEWSTIEEPYQPSQALKKLSPGKVVLLDCITVLISNLLLKGDEVDTDVNQYQPRGEEREIMEEMEAIIEVSREKELDLIIVSNEVGQGLVPVYELGRNYRDIAGRANQLLAGAADEVYLVYAGLPVEIKQPGLKNLEKFQER